jgi:molybdopterin molybdotransferase
MPRGEPVSELTPLADALAMYTHVVAPLDVEPVRLDDGLGRVLAAPAEAAIDLPAFTQSAMDGYAIRSEDVADASPERAVRLDIVEAIPAGTTHRPRRVAPGQAARILTGAPLPPDSDAVVRQEWTRRAGEQIAIETPVAAGAAIRRRGEELAAGTPLGGAGHRLTPGLVAALAMAGVASVEVRKRPRIAVLITGDELAPPGEQLQYGQIRDSNGPLARNWLARQGWSDPPLRYVSDDAAAVEAALDAALGAADLVITTGGVSVGDRDYVPGAATRLGCETLFWKVAQKPGKPLYFARRGNTFLLGLPGNPAAVLIGLALHARRVLDCFEKTRDPHPLFRPGRLADSVKMNRQRVQLLRAHMDIDAAGVVNLHPLPKQGSHMLSNLQCADALVWVPAGEGDVERGRILEWTAL